MNYKSWLEGATRWSDDEYEEIVALQQRVEEARKQLGEAISVTNSMIN
jgi:hypothetical protein